MNNYELLLFPVIGFIVGYYLPGITAFIVKAIKKKTK